MFRSFLDKRYERFKKKCSIYLEYINDSYNVKNITGGINLNFQARLVKIENGEFIGRPIFKMKMNVGPSVVKIDDIEATGFATTSNSWRELFFHLLIYNIKSEMTRRGKLSILVGSKDYFIQEALIANGFKLKTVYNSNDETIYAGVWKKDDNTKTESTLAMYV